MVENTSEENTSPRKFQWIKGENAGNVEVLKEEVTKKNILWYHFKSGNRANSQLIGDYFVEILDGGIAVDPSVDPLVGLVSENHSIPVEKIIKPKISPIRELLDKQKDSSREEIKLELVVRVPKTPMYELLESSYGNEVSIEIVNSIIESLDKDSLRILITGAIEKHYGIENTKEEK